jgi:hypothetical protein
MGWRSKREARKLEELVNSQLDVWRARAAELGFTVGELAMWQWWHVVVPEIDSLSEEHELARYGDADAAGRAQVGYRSMTLTSEWLKRTEDQAAVASTCVATYEAVDVETRAAMGEQAVDERGLPLHLIMRGESANAWMRLAEMAMRSEQEGADG